GREAGALRGWPAKGATRLRSARPFTSTITAVAEEAGGAEEQDEDQEREARELLQRGLEEDRPERLRDRDEQPPGGRAEEAPHPAGAHDAERGYRAREPG